MPNTFSCREGGENQKAKNGLGHL
jgi:hypothetical protein